MKEGAIHTFISLFPERVRYWGIPECSVVAKEQADRLCRVSHEPVVLPALTQELTVIQWEE